MIDTDADGPLRPKDDLREEIESAVDVLLMRVKTAELELWEVRFGDFIENIRVLLHCVNVLLKVLDHDHYQVILLRVFLDQRSNYKPINDAASYNQNSKEP